MSDVAKTQEWAQKLAQEIAADPLGTSHILYNMRRTKEKLESKVAELEAKNDRWQNEMDAAVKKVLKSYQRAKAAEARLAKVRELKQYEASPYELIPERPFLRSVGAYWKVVMVDELESLLTDKADE